MLRVKPPSFTRLEQLSLIRKNYRARQTCFLASSRNSQNQPCRKLNCRKTSCSHLRSAGKVARLFDGEAEEEPYIRSRSFLRTAAETTMPARRPPDEYTLSIRLLFANVEQLLGSRVGGVFGRVVIKCELACSIKGNVKGNTPPSTGRGADFLDFQPLRALRHVLLWYRPHLFAFQHGLSVMRRRQSVCETWQAFRLYGVNHGSI